VVCLRDSEGRSTATVPREYCKERRWIEMIYDDRPPEAVIANWPAQQPADVTQCGTVHATALVREQLLPLAELIASAVVQARLENG